MGKEDEGRVARCEKKEIMSKGARDVKNCTGSVNFLGRRVVPPQPSKKRNFQKKYEILSREVRKHGFWWVTIDVVVFYDYKSASCEVLGPLF